MNRNQTVLDVHQADLPFALGSISIQCNANAVTSIRFSEDRLPVPIESFALTASSSVLQAAMEQLELYFEGELQAFDLPLEFNGTPFQNDVWKALQEIPFGKVRSYSDIATAIGRPKAVRAVGAAIGANPIAIVIPCHRVIGSNGTLTGFAGGLDRKSWLLELENALQVKNPRQRELEFVSPA